MDALGNLVRFVLLPGHRHDTLGVAPLIADVAFAALLGDKAFDVDWLRADLDKRGAAAVIPPKSNRKTAVIYDKAMYRWRHLIENFFAKLKRVPRNCHPLRQDRRQLPGQHPARSSHHRWTVIVNGP